jgi:TPR repeat protein
MPIDLAQYREWRAAPERERLARALELLKSQPSNGIAELERLTGSRAEIARQLAMHNLGLAYWTGEAHGHADYVQAEDWFRRASNEGYQPAEYELGKMLRKQDEYERALDVLKRSAAIGYAPSMRLVGTMYSHGDGVVRDLAEARRWWERAIERGNVWAKRKLAVAMLARKYGWTRVPLGAFLFLAALVDATTILLTRSETDVRLW